MNIEAMQMAISTLEGWANVDYWVWPETAKEQAKRNTVESITALRQAIEQEEKQEPVAWMVYTLDGKSVCVTDNPSDFTPDHHALPLYTAPVDAVNTSQENVDETAERKHMTDLASVGEVGVWGEREWVGLTAEEIWQCNTAPAGHHVECHICVAHQNVLDFAEAIEAKLKEKNT